MLSDVLSAKFPPHAPTASAQLDDIIAADEKLRDFVKLHRDFFGWVVEGSPFLAGLMRRYPDMLLALQSQPPEDVLTALIDNFFNALADNKQIDEADFMAELRDMRNRFALIVGLADLANIWDVPTVTHWLTRLADIAVSSALDFCLHQAVVAGKLQQFSHDGLVVLALGKHGGEELNYSSDIDFVVYYTPDALPLAAAVDERHFYVQIVQKLAAILQTRTADGFVFRVDLRLRPDPGATPVAISLAAALAYYEMMGQNWERAVYIKARPIAGDLAAGAAFLKELTPYIWRRYYDFAAIEDVHSMKRQIHATRGFAKATTRGHNLKLGRGGIREIEFFVQTQQLIAGGRDTDLRGRSTTNMLAMLAQKNWISQETADGLTQSYNWLRRMEHRLQMRLDEQTQTLPDDEARFAAFTQFANYATPEDFSTDLLAHLHYVSGEYAKLFEQSDSLSGAAGNLVFTGVDDDPDTLETIANMGFKRPRDMLRIIRDWHGGRLRATRSVRARETLTRLMPILLSALANTPDPDDSFIRFDKFLNALPTGVQLFAMFQSQPHILRLLVDIVSVTPRLAIWLSRYAHLLDTLIHSNDVEAVDKIIKTAPEDDFETVLDKVRLHIHEGQFRVGVDVLADPIMATMAGARFTALAEQAISTIWPAVVADMQAQFGQPPEASLLIIGMGKLGSGEMALQSDLDLIFICDSPDFDAPSDGRKAISADIWFARAVRRLLSGLTVATAEGALYNVDTRLRPSGNAGALVTKLSGFIEYQKNHAWLWEHMALTCARIIGGGIGNKTNGAPLDGLAQKTQMQIQTQIKEIICHPRQAQDILAGVADMRTRLRKHQPQNGPFDIRRGAGGLVDLEFFVQALQIAHAPKNEKLLNVAPLSEKLTQLRDGDIVPMELYEKLSAAATTYLTLRQVASLSLEDSEKSPNPAVRGLFLRATHQPDWRQLEETLAHHRQIIAQAHDTIKKYI